MFNEFLNKIFNVILTFYSHETWSVALTHKTIRMQKRFTIYFFVNGKYMIQLWKPDKILKINCDNSLLPPYDIVDTNKKFAD